MRISDWSSDVCSSDLCSGKSSPEPGGAFGSATITGHGSLTETTLPTGKVVPSAAYCGGVGFSPSPGHSTNSPMIVASATRASEVSRKNRDTNPDRKSVVSGKSVSVRVDLGGRRHMNKKRQPANRGEKKTGRP